MQTRTVTAKRILTKQKKGFLVGAVSSKGLQYPTSGVQAGWSSDGFSSIPHRHIYNPKPENALL